MSHAHGEAIIIEKVHQKYAKSDTETVFGWFSPLSEEMFRCFSTLLSNNTIVGGGWKEEEEEDNLTESVLNFLGLVWKKVQFDFQIQTLGKSQRRAFQCPVQRNAVKSQTSAVMNPNSVLKLRCLGVHNIGTEVHAASVWKVHPVTTISLGSPLSSLQSWTHSLLLKKCIPEYSCIYAALCTKQSLGEWFPFRR